MKKKNILISAVAILAIAAIAIATLPPPANQLIGFTDTKLANLVEQNCRNCHTGLPDRHHNLVAQPNSPWECMDCHPVITLPDNTQTVLIDRNCINCHNGSAFYANPIEVNLSTRPHHNKTQAQNRQCGNTTGCHGSYVDNYDDGHYIPTYNTSIVTPYADYKIFNATSSRYWGGCQACHQAGVPNILGNHDTHHNATNLRPGRTLGLACNWCHVINTTSGSVLRLNRPDNTQYIEVRNSTLGAVNGTGCEKCHSVKSIHNIQYNYSATQGTPGYGHIGNNWDCNGCHAFWDAGAAPMQGAIIPQVDSITPSKLTTGVATQVTITGVNFVNGQYSSVVAVDGVKYTPTSISDTQIIVTIPGLTAGVHELELVKSDAVSKLSTLVVVTPTDAVTAKLASGKITIAGKGFGAKPDALFTDLGVWVNHTAKGKTTTSKATVVSWSDTQIVVNAGTAANGDKVTVKTLNGQDIVTIAKR